MGAGEVRERVWSHGASGKVLGKRRLVKRCCPSLITHVHTIRGV